MGKLPGDQIVHLWIALALPTPLRLIPQELFCLEVANFAFEDFEVGEFSVTVIVIDVGIEQGSTLGDQCYLAASDNFRVGLAGFGLDPSFALLGVLLAEVEGDLATIRTLQEYIFLIRMLQHIIFFIISMLVFI